jgi:chromosome partitioning protein
VTCIQLLIRVPVPEVAYPNGTLVYRQCLVSMVVSTGLRKAHVTRSKDHSKKFTGIENVSVGPTGRPLREFAKPQPLTSHGPARIISLCNQKGGVGKTTTTINMGAALAEYGRRVLVIDFDPQGALSAGLGVQPQDQTTIYDLLLSSQRNPHDAIQHTSVEGLDIIPANIDLSAAEVHLVNEVAREQILARVLRKVSNDYDVILVDCQPSLGLLTVNALTASHGVIIPLEAEFFALRGVALLVETIDKVRDRLNPAIQLDGILVTMYDSRTLHSREVLERVIDAFGDKVLDTVVSRTVKFPDASVAGAPIIQFAPEHKAAQAYRQLARELIARGDVA